MFKKVTVVFDPGKLANCACFFGCMTLGIAAIAGMVWAYCGAKPGKESCRTAAGAAEMDAEP